MAPILGGIMIKQCKSMVILGDCPYNNALFGFVSYNDPWYSNWETLISKLILEMWSNFFFEIEGRSAQIRMCPPLLQWGDLDFEIDFGTHVKQIFLKLQYQFPVTGKQDL